MRRVSLVVVAASVLVLALVAGSARAGVGGGVQAVAPLAFKAPGGPIKVQASWLQRSSGWSGCTAGPGGAIHCYLPSDIRQAYGVDQVSEQGDGQTIVLVDSYGDPMAAQELQVFHDALMPGAPSPNFDQVYPLGKPDYSHANPNAQGLSGPGAAAGWAEEAALDVQWAYAIAPKAHIVLMAMPPAETLGVQGFPNIFKAISRAIDTYPSGTVFSMSLAVTEQTFGGAAAVQTAKFDKVFEKGIAKGDSFFGASGDSGTLGYAKQHKQNATYPFPTVEWPTSSPYVTSVGGTQLQFGWTWNPQSDVPVTADGGLNPDYFNWNATDTNTNVVWNESWLPAATGGGPSAIYPRPSWQDSVASVIGGDQRGVPDVSWNAAVNGGVLVVLLSFLPADQQGIYIFGGTSAATPQVAALTALLNEHRASLNEDPIGDLASALYSASSGDFNDVAPIHQGAIGVLSGDLTSNTMFDYNGNGNAVTVGSVPGSPTLPGWDMTTGFGTPWAPNFINDLS